MRRVFSFYQSTIGKKYIMAVTGLIFIAYVIAHMLGNLKIYMGPEKINAYGRFLRDVGHDAFGHSGLLWVARIVLLVAVILHAWAAISLWRASRVARPVGYRKVDLQAATYASRSMRVGGLLLAVFVVYHILHLTTGQANPDFHHGDVYGNVVAGFSVWWASAFYIIAMGALGLHLYHGTWSFLQTLGAAHPKYNAWRKRLAWAVALIVTIANISFPIAVLIGVVK
jgi:succinate dehydrogenase / fumarate reductase cytochrome b subunit